MHGRGQQQPDAEKEPKQMPQLLWTVEGKADQTREGKMER
jgi:hypothetical protein